MHLIHRCLAIGAVALALAACERGDEPRTGALAEEPSGVSAAPPAQQAANQAPDNTGRNAMDRSGQTPTPMDQSNDPRDVETTRKIREAITSHEGLSVNARNVKVITQGGSVVLRGPVDSEQEKQTVETLARNAAAGSQVDSQLQVAAPGT